MVGSRLARAALTPAIIRHLSDPDGSDRISHRLRQRHCRPFTNIALNNAPASNVPLTTITAPLEQADRYRHFRLVEGPRHRKTLQSDYGHSLLPKDVGTHSSPNAPLKHSSGQTRRSSLIEATAATGCIVPDRRIKNHSRIGRDAIASAHIPLVTGEQQFVIFRGPSRVSQRRVAGRIHVLGKSRST